jgi:hypothetical protein
MAELFRVVKYFNLPRHMEMFEFTRLFFLYLYVGLIWFDTLPSILKTRILKILKTHGLVEDDL